MKNSSLKIIQSYEFDDLFKIMKESFPNVERRSFEDQKSLFEEKRYKVFGYKENDDLIGFLATWEFENFNFIEHFAVDSNARGKKRGTFILKQYLKKCNKQIFLEVEEPTTEIAARRIEFYKRLGFNLNSYNYLQPPLQKQNPLLPLKVMSYPRNVTASEFMNFKKIVYDKVYKVHKSK